ncbi:hypothetical protein [Carboxylicivirga sp. RSCT41]|uniref:hypothetical protein n=1 Tax=Carboxylicivirga agarovorans TaxID=3417570 RepID=UPI003D33CBDD
MNKLILYLSIWTLVGCSQDALEHNEQHIRFDETYYANIGKLHNEGLDNVLEQLKSLKQNQLQSISKENLQAEIVDASINFMREKEEIDISLKDLVTNVCEQTLYYNGRDKDIVTRLKKLLEGVTETDIRRNHFRQFGNVSDRQLEYIHRMETIFKDQNQMGIIKALIDLKDEVNTALTEDDAYPILCGIYTGIYSLKYWKVNAIKWQMSLMDLEQFDAEDIGSLKSSLKGNPVILSQFVDFPDGVYPWPGEPTLAIVVTNGKVAIIRGPKGTVFDPDLGVFVMEGSVNFDLNKLSTADWQGAIGGAIGGMISGAVAGGAGALPGAGIGFIAGGIGSSAAEAIGQLIFY